MPAQLKEIFKQTNPYYQQGAPLLLEAHALYEDTTTGKLIAQLKWRNLSHQTVQAVNVILHCKDSFGAALETTHYQYVDVSVAPQAIFGTQNPIDLVNALTRQCSVSITGVAFGDGSIWTATGDDACEALPAGKAQTLSDDMLFQFKSDLNSEHIGAAAKTKKRNIIIVSVLAVAVAVAVALVFTLVIQPKQKYDAASALLANGQYDEALAAFSEIESYGDVKALIQNAENLAQAAAAAALEAKFTVGNTMTFGSYEQDDNTSNGAEAIEWLVLAREGDRALVISVDGLDCVPYHTEFIATTWETSTLRTWMNDTFLNTAFTQKEQQAIPTVPITTPENPYYGTNPGNDTKDKVFCLSIQEAESLFSSDNARQSKPTPYAEKQGAYTNDGGYCYWGLRSLGGKQCLVAGVTPDGSVFSSGWGVGDGIAAVRPALWLDLTSGIF